MWKEFRPTINFLGKFVGIYLLFNVIYGLWITSYDRQPDPMTIIATKHAGWFLDAIGFETGVLVNEDKPTADLALGERRIVSVYEGCNGINIAIVFLAFVGAFGPYRIALLWFIMSGLLLIHIANVGRIVALFVVSVKLPDYFYFVHKYAFTASIYLFIFLLWMWWVNVNRKQS